MHSYLTKNYPDGEYYSVYEAGFCGFWIHDRLVSLGINNIVVNPGDVPTTNAEKLKKTYAVDSAKMARSLREGSLSPIYTPKRQDLELRTLIRMKDMLTKSNKIIATFSWDEFKLLYEHKFEPQVKNTWNSPEKDSVSVVLLHLDIVILQF